MRCPYASGKIHEVISERFVPRLCGVSALLWAMSNENPEYQLHDPVEPLTNLDQSIHAEIDFSHDYTEINIKEGKQYYDTLPNVRCFCINVSIAGTLIFLWRQQDGGKGAAEALNCLWIMICKYLCGAGHLTISMDTAGHVWNQYLIKMVLDNCKEI